MARTLTASVGRMGGINYRKDVITVQQLLNRVPVTEGGPKPPLVVDGLCGSKTVKAIQLFQVKQIGWSGADGRVDPNGPTHTRLNTYDKPGGGKPNYPGLPFVIFYIRRLGSKTSFRPVSRELIFEVTEVPRGFYKAYYWLQLPGHIMSGWENTGTSTYTRFHTNVPRKIYELTCPAIYHSHRVSGKVSSHMELYLRGLVRIGSLQSGAHEIDKLPHHLIGPNGMIGPGPNDVSTSVSGLFQLIG
jgi:hypothetical protein